MAFVSEELSFIRGGPLYQKRVVDPSMAFVSEELPFIRGGPLYQKRVIDTSMAFISEELSFIRGGGKRRYVPPFSAPGWFVRCRRAP